MAASRSCSRNAREYFELKQRAVKFYKENGVPEKLEEILNAMVYDHPPDVYGRLSEYFESISKAAIISKLESHEALDGKGQPTLQADVHCIVKGTEKHIASCTMASFNHLPDTAPIEKKLDEEKERQEFVETAIGYIHGPIADALCGLDPTNQIIIDQLLCSTIEKLKKEQEALLDDKDEISKVENSDVAQPSEMSKVPTDTKRTSAKAKKKGGSAKSFTAIVQEPKELMFCGCNAICAVSQAVAKTGAAVRDIPLYEYIASLYEKDQHYQYSIPIPMMAVLSSGKTAPGKQNLIKEVLLIPAPDMAYNESLKKLVQIYHQVAKLQFSRVGVSAYYTNDFGGICPQYDKPDQLLDLINEALVALEMTAGVDVFLGLNCAAHEIYDPDKGKYEIMVGTMKTGDDMIEVYADIISRYPGVIALIDPLQKHESVAWNKLCAQLSEKCFIVGDQVYPRPERFLRTGFQNLEVNGVSLKFQQMTTVTDILHTTTMIKDNNCVTMLAAVSGDASDTFLADLAVGIQATFVKFGAPVRGERVALYNRLGRIADRITRRDQLLVRSEFPFCAVLQPELDQQDDQSSS